MRCAWTLAAVVCFVVGCDGPVTVKRNARTHLTEEYFRKQRECEARPPPLHAWNATVDYGPPVLDSERPAVWKAQRMYLGNTCVIANVGPYYYVGEEGGPPASYAIDVEVRGIDSTQDTNPSYRVLFQRHFRSNELPAGFEHKAISEIVTFIESDRLVRFAIEDRVFEYQVPAL